MNFSIWRAITQTHSLRFRGCSLNKNSAHISAINRKTCTRPYALNENDDVYNENHIMFSLWKAEERKGMEKTHTHTHPRHEHITIICSTSILDPEHWMNLFSLFFEMEDSKKGSSISFFLDTRDENFTVNWWRKKKIR